jgi:hypothetical protein
MNPFGQTAGSMSVDRISWGDSACTRVAAEAGAAEIAAPILQAWQEPAKILTTAGS